MLNVWLNEELKKKKDTGEKMSPGKPTHVNNFKIN